MAQDGVNHPTIPAVIVSLADGATLKAHVPGSVTVDGTTFFDFVTTNADILAAFSSRGPTPYDFRLKPDVTAPGVSVLSSVLGGQFAFFQGTSMATPHTTGAAALLLAAHPTWSPDEVKSALVNYADRTVTGTGGLGPIARGGGFELCRVISKVEPQVDDPSVQSRIDQRLLDRHFSELMSKYTQRRLGSAPISTE